MYVQVFLGDKNSIDMSTFSVWNMQNLKHGKE